MKPRKAFRAALVGADSLLLKELKAALAELMFPLAELEFYDPGVQEEFSKLIQFGDSPKVVHNLDARLLEGLDLVFLATDPVTGRECGRLALEKKTRAVDLSGAFIQDVRVPVVVAGVNSGPVLKDAPFLIANPHAVTIILSQIFRAVIPRFGLKQALAFVLQPASAFDDAGIEELAGQSVAMLSSSAVRKKIFKDQIAFNLLSHWEALDAAGFSTGERRIMDEVSRIFKRPGFPLSLSIVQAPVFHTYSIMAHLELEKKADIGGLERLFKAHPLFRVPARACPVNSLGVAGQDQIFIGQIKQDPASPRGFWLWTVTDNLTFGSALNAVKIGRGLLDACLKDRA